MKTDQSVWQTPQSSSGSVKSIYENKVLAHLQYACFDTAYYITSLANIAASVYI